jgi:predicted flap endonuclease-1-like 5' DNA nuclease
MAPAVPAARYSNKPSRLHYRATTPAKLAAIPSPPTSADAIEKYLSSGMIRGVGPVYAKKLVRAFGEKVFDVIEATPDRLREVAGIGPVRAASILAAWAEHRPSRAPVVHGSSDPPSFELLYPGHVPAGSTGVLGCGDRI